MSRTRIVLLALAGLVVLLASLHVAVNGLPDLSSWNPHAR